MRGWRDCGPCRVFSSPTYARQDVQPDRDRTDKTVSALVPTISPVLGYFGSDRYFPPRCLNFTEDEM
jgi:hypothetical protein